MSEHIYSALVIYMGVAKGRRIQPNSHARAIYFTSLAGTICWRGKQGWRKGVYMLILMRFFEIHLPDYALGKVRTSS